MDYNKILAVEQSLDPKDWQEMRKLAHHMVDDMFSYLEDVREQKVWQETPSSVITNLSQKIPQQPQDIGSIYEDFKRDVLPYNKGNAHPRFLGMGDRDRHAVRNDGGNACRRPQPGYMHGRTFTNVC